MAPFQGWEPKDGEAPRSISLLATENRPKMGEGIGGGGWRESNGRGGGQS